MSYGTLAITRLGPVELIELTSADGMNCYTPEMGEDLVAALRYTRGQAIVKGKPQVLKLDLDANSYIAPGKKAVSLPKDMVLRLTTAETEQTGANAGGIRFFADGSSTGGHISVLMGQREWRINVAWLTGEIALDDKPQ